MTLIELMIALLVASILIGFVFDIQSRMSNAYRAQTNVGAVQQGLRAAAEMIAHDARSAGFKMPNGIQISSNFPAAGITTPGLVLTGVDHFGLGNHSFLDPVKVFNNPEGRAPGQMQPDQVHFFYGVDENTHAVIDNVISPTVLSVDDLDSFDVNDRVLIVNRPQVTPHPLGGASGLPEVASYHACVLEVTNLDLTTADLTFATTSPFNTATNDHCSGIAVVGASVYRFVSHAYRIDVTRPGAALLQRSTSGGLVNDWEDVGIGFVDLQLAERHVQIPANDVDGDADGDGFARMDWYSSGNAPPPAAFTPPAPRVLTLTQLGIGLVARTLRRVSGVTTADIPVLSVGDPNHNPVGDAGGPKSKTEPEFVGEHVYRQSTITVDTRNVGVAQ